MTSTGTFKGLSDGRNSSKVLKPPGGGSSDIFGASADESPRRVKHHNQSQLGSALFGDGGASTGSSSPETPRANKPGNDSYKRLFGPPDPTTHNTKYHMRSNIALNGDRMNNITSMINGARINGGSALINGNANTNDNTGGSSCMPRNPVTGDGIDITPFRRSTRKCRGNLNALPIGRR
ncbi:hypothetical protein PV328_003117 [Microctonus aethiopoides]|uniref:Microtubule-associated protein Jupiter n=1 Tax=Microctonus aethiopoides TaxID=144406 RepID=A0AA39F7P5_9HYME|nr:hypothetical protein PV328_003117 [Microctonus aethiopoides]